MGLGDKVHLISNDGEHFSTKRHYLLSASPTFVGLNLRSRWFFPPHDQITFTDRDATGETLSLFLGLITTGELLLWWPEPGAAGTRPKPTWRLDTLARLARFLVKYKCAVPQRQLSDALARALRDDVGVSNLTVYTVAGILDDRELARTALVFVRHQVEVIRGQYWSIAPVADSSLCPLSMPRVAIHYMPAAYFVALMNDWVKNGPGSRCPKGLGSGFNRRLRKFMRTYPLPPIKIQEQATNNKPQPTQRMNEDETSGESIEGIPQANVKRITKHSTSGKSKVAPNMERKTNQVTGSYDGIVDQKAQEELNKGINKRLTSFQADEKYEETQMLIQVEPDQKTKPKSEASGWDRLQRLFRRNRGGDTKTPTVVDDGSTPNDNDEKSVAVLLH